MKQSTAWSMPELAAGGEQRCGRSKYAKGEHRFLLRRATTRETQRRKFATVRRALFRTRSVAENALSVWRQRRPAQTGNAQLVHASARSPRVDIASEQLFAGRCATSPVLETSRNKMRRQGANQMMASTPNAQRLTSSVQFKTRRVNLLKHDLEELNALPFSRYVWIECGVFHPCAVSVRRPRIQHLKWIPAPNRLRNHSLDFRAL